jgi:hypothetical protein
LQTREQGRAGPRGLTTRHTRRLEAKDAWTIAKCCKRSVSVDNATVDELGLALIA